MPYDETVNKVGLTSTLTHFLNFMEHFTHQTIHPRKRKPLFAQVFDGGTDVVELLIVDDEETANSPLISVANIEIPYSVKTSGVTVECFKLDNRSQFATSVCFSSFVSLKK